MVFRQGGAGRVLVPGGILTTAALIFFACNVFGWSTMAVLWPGLILGVAIGLFEAYYFDPGKPRPVLIASAIIGSAAAVFFGFTLVFTNGFYFVAVSLIVAGMLLLFRRPGR